MPSVRMSLRSGLFQTVVLPFSFPILRDFLFSKKIVPLAYSENSFHLCVVKNGNRMKTAGIIIEHNAGGAPTFARIDLKRYGDKLKDFFEAEGVIIEKSSPYNPEFVAKIKRGEEQIEKGNFHRLDPDNPWK
jgi:hypothetical protein